MEAAIAKKNSRDVTSTAGQNIPSTDITLQNDVLEKIYRSYSLKQKRSGMNCFMAAAILFDLWAIFIPANQSWLNISIMGLFLVMNITLTVLLQLCGKSNIRGNLWITAPYIAWLLAISQLIVQLIFTEDVKPRELLGWAILFNFLVYITLPILLQYTGIILSMGTFFIYLFAVIALSASRPNVWYKSYIVEQIIADIILIIAAIAIGLLYYYLGEAKHRRAFLEAKQSLEVKMIIEEQSAEQERLLLSVLPEHVAVKMRQDLGSTDSEQFKKIYMSRHENVSILYADIVGFTQISSTYSAQDLVKILNELFARFDRLAEKYQQLRIKILGDCYYCISGAPIEIPEHAVLSVHMGLSMVKAIKYVQQKTNSPVDMRVGIHTGAVLAGILGQKQWQFDVYSKDVELANKMESSGMAGRVHISEKTLSFLNGEFGVEAAFGEKREESLRIAGLKTYFITNIIKPFVHDLKNGSTKSDNRMDDSEVPTESSREHLDSKCTSPGEEDPQVLDDKIDDDAAENYKIRLRKELVSRDGHGELSKDTTIFLTFNDRNLEKAFIKHREPLSTIPLAVPVFIHLIGMLYAMFVNPVYSYHFCAVAVPVPVLMIFLLWALPENFPSFPPILIIMSRQLNEQALLRTGVAVASLLLVIISNILDTYVSSYLMVTSYNLTNTTLDDELINPADYCMFPSYYSNYTVLILIAVSIITQLPHIAKVVLMILTTAFQCYLNIDFLFGPFDYEEFRQTTEIVPFKYNLSALLVATTIALSFLARHIEQVDRVIFMWKNEVKDQKEKASDMRRRNEALVYNVLPMHVAEHFMGNRKRSHDELYSQSYAEVGVLFASMPNFSDFYSEETVNNQGLECLRFLNEVISDFDALLELPKFQDIIKIKTIGSTYMAASGLNPARITKADDPIIVRWAHLDLLVEFALELKKALQGINEQSFNHFVLKMGINHGPITAGVIGARKPHYDIWGNTVNVASRMESTGKAGCIQVTEETCGILQKCGYTFEQRGLVAVKGKGQLMTYYLVGKDPHPPTPGDSTNSQPEDVMPDLVSTEVKETTAAVPSIHDSPAHGTTSISSSTTSPNSVRLNQNYVEIKMDTSNINNSNNNNNKTSDNNYPNQSNFSNDIEIQIEDSLNDINTSADNLSNENDDHKEDVKTPLISSTEYNSNSNSSSTTATTIVTSTNIKNIETDSFRIDEKSSLLDNVN